MFRDGVGQFLGDAVYDGIPIRVRLTWRVHSVGSAIWEQAFFADGGQMWETNWTNELARTSD